jgi:hypothetical protein
MEVEKICKVNIKMQWFFQGKLQIFVASYKATINL